MAALRVARVRLGILQDRNEGCPDKHEVSAIEVPGWLEEMDDLLARLRTLTPTEGGTDDESR